MGGSYSLTLARLNALVERAIEDVLSRHSLRIEDWRVIDRLAEAGPSPMTTLASETLITGPTLTRTVDKLASLGLVHRTAGVEDRRKVLVNISARGSEVRDRLVPAVLEAERAALHSEDGDVELRRLACVLLAPESV